MPVFTKKNGLIYCVYFDAGKKIWEPFGRGHGAKQAAEARDLDIRLKKKRGQWDAVGSSYALSFSELVHIYIEHRKIDLSPKTIKEILRTLANHILPFISNKLLPMINIQDWNKIQGHMVNAGVGARSINKYFQYASGIFSWAEENLYISDHPWRKRKPLRTLKKFKIDLFTIEEFAKIMAASPDHLQWCLEVAYNSGVRPGPTELFNIKWADIQWDMNRIRIYASKTDTWRWQYFTPKFMGKLKAKNKESNGCQYIVSYQGKRVNSVSRAWQTAKKKAGITRRIRLYDIRHFYITYALANGADIRDLAERVGHVNGEMIMRVYAHLAKDLQKKTAFNVPNLPNG
jgi:integrase